MIKDYFTEKLHTVGFESITITPDDFLGQVNRETNLTLTSVLNNLNGVIDMETAVSNYYGFLAKVNGHEIVSHNRSYADVDAYLKQGVKDVQKAQGFDFLNKPRSVSNFQGYLFSIHTYMSDIPEHWAYLVENELACLVFSDGEEFSITPLHCDELKVVGLIFLNNLFQYGLNGKITHSFYSLGGVQFRFDQAEEVAQKITSRFYGRAFILTGTVATSAKQFKIARVIYSTIHLETYLFNLLRESLDLDGVLQRNHDHVDGVNIDFDYRFPAHALVYPPAPVVQAPAKDDKATNYELQLIVAKVTEALSVKPTTSTKVTNTEIKTAVNELFGSIEVTEDYIKELCAKVADLLDTAKITENRKKEYNKVANERKRKKRKEASDTGNSNEKQKDGNKTDNGKTAGKKNGGKSSGKSNKSGEGQPKTKLAGSLQSTLSVQINKDA